MNFNHLYPHSPMLFNLLLVGLLGGTPPAADPPAEVPRVSALRITPAHGVPKLDGRLDEAVWMAADSLSDFVQVEPRPGESSAFPHRCPARVR